MTRKYMLEEQEIPTHYYNILADLPTPLDPPLHPGTKQPIGPQDLAPLFPMELIKQEVSSERSLNSRCIRMLMPHIDRRLSFVLWTLKKHSILLLNILQI